MKQTPKELVDGLSICWPHVMIFARDQLKTTPPYIDVDDNIVDFIGERGRARYYIDKARSNEHELVIEKFYGITF